MSERKSEKTTFERYKEILERTTITETLDYKSLLINALSSVNVSILEGKAEITNNAIWTLRNLIPSAWQDEQFRNDIDKCYIEKKVDIRPEFCGNKASLKFCEKHKLDPYRTEKRIEHFQMLSACVNLLERLGVLMRRTPKAWIAAKSGVNPNDGENPESPVH
jgi:hypothetical protein